MKRLFFNTLFNLSLFLLLMVGIQNSTDKKKVNLIYNETINLPVSFIIGASFITGSLIGSFFKLNIRID